MLSSVTVQVMTKYIEYFNHIKGIEDVAECYTKRADKDPFKLSEKKKKQQTNKNILTLVKKDN